jgi:hypothetical protein
MIYSAVPAVQKGNIHRASGRYSTGRVNPEVRTFGKKQQVCLEYNKGINC